MKLAFKRSADAERAMHDYRASQPRLFFQSGFKSKPWIVATAKPANSVELFWPIVWDERQCAKAAK